MTAVYAAFAARRREICRAHIRDGEEIASFTALVKNLNSKRNLDFHALPLPMRDRSASLSAAELNTPPARVADG
ncbi:hypothetical protein AGR13a_Lc30104 [Agrobacterium genomosp. 13 str. CFBP 6927]|uniref:Uncharacterized protein n=1 Tax=Agrobacterium genomosp. 13 str. CFBP 6927 TaxID=1183428 RepID=A0ABM9VLA0_9HYPH|nr:hypothetical protein AGR13a_Lc30104 [Agrobacterium genomosp. 13 str. CFBP 6927]